MNWLLVLEIEFIVILAGVIISLTWYSWVCWLWHTSETRARRRNNRYYSFLDEDNPGTSGRQWFSYFQE